MLLTFIQWNILLGKQTYCYSKSAYSNNIQCNLLSGVTLIGIFTIPQEDGCHEDALCLWLAEKVGRDASIEIKGEIGVSSFKFAAKLVASIVVVKDKLSLKEIELSLELSGMESNVRLSCTLLWNDRSILGEDQINFRGTDRYMFLTTADSYTYNCNSVLNFKVSFRGLKRGVVIF